MHKYIRRIDPERGIVQITTLDERWYAKEVENRTTGIPEIQFRPSVTWIADYYPKGKGFEMWLKKHGSESDQIARLAADRGYKVHRAIANLNEGERVNLHDPFESSDTGEFEPLTADEYAAVMSYVDWWEAEGFDQYEILAFEKTLWPVSDEFPSDFFFAGTMDLLLFRKSDNTKGVVDMKTSLDIWPSHEMQVSAYKRAVGADWAAILQLDYRRNKKKRWKFTEVTDCFDLFLHTKAIWARETAGVEPLQRDFPLYLSLKGRVKEETKEVSI